MDHPSNITTSTRVYPGLDSETQLFVQQLHHAWSTRAPLSAYVEIRNGLLHQRDRFEARVAALSAVVRIACPDDHGVAVDDHWQDLFALAKAIETDGKKRKKAYQEGNRLRNYVVVISFWSPQVATHYGWDKIGQAQMYALRGCATQYPNFTEDFCPRFNSILLERHCLGIKDARVKTLNEASIQPSRDMNLCALASAIPNRRREIPWLTDGSGNFSIEAGGPLLNQLRPHHFQSYLLRKDRFGVLTARDQGFLQQPREDALQLVSPSHKLAGISRSNVGSNVFTQSQRKLAMSLESLQVPRSAFSTNIDPCLTTSPRDILSPSEEGLSLTDVTMSDGPITAPNRDQIHGIESNTNVTPARSRSDSNSEVDSGLESEPDTDMTSDSESPREINTETHDRERRTPVMLTSKFGEGIRQTQTFPRSKTGMLKPAGPKSLREAEFTIASPSMNSNAPLSMEETLHKRHHELLTAYIAKLAHEACHTNSGPQRKLRAKWYTPNTKWASVWTHSKDQLPFGRAPSENEAEVIYYTSDEFITACQNRQIFRKPIVIKERFLDSRMHTVDGMASLLENAPYDAVVQVRTLDNIQPAPLPVHDFTNDIKTDQLEGANVLNLRNVTKSHRPLFTMLPRFRLLQSLVERAQDRVVGQGTMPTPGDMTGYTGSNILGFVGAFTGANLGSLCGTWVRNLGGLKFWMIVPDEEIESDWETFAELGCNWVPNGRERLVLLEQDDVLVMPPGLKVVHAVHSPTNCLMEAGTFWDELNIIKTLESICWICENPATTVDPIAYQLPLLIDELEGLVREQPNRFRGESSKAEFLRAFDQAVSDLRDLGCDCSSQSDWCECRQEGRLCNAWCSGHGR